MRGGEEGGDERGRRGGESSVQCMVRETEIEWNTDRQEELQDVRSAPCLSNRCARAAEELMVLCSDVTFCSSSATSCSKCNAVLLCTQCGDNSQIS
jgi:hypothetical protein